MRKVFKIMSLTLILALFFSIMGFAETDESMILKIGLQYTAPDNQTSKPLVVIKGSLPFEVAELVNNEYTTRFQTTLTSFSFDKDNGYHAVVGPYNTYNEAAAVISQVTGGFVVLKDKYYVYSTSANQSTASNEVHQLSGRGLNSVLGNPEASLVVVKSGQVILGFDSSRDIFLAPSSSELKGQHSYFGSDQYRGGFGAKRQNTQDISLVNYVRMNEYLYGVVPREMSKEWPIEALKAQALVARNFALANMNKFQHYGFNLDDTSLSQVYGGYDWEGPISNQAVDETNGLTLKHDNTLVNAFYHSNSGGFTENSENVFSSPLPYIKGVYDPFSLGAPNDAWMLNYSKSFLETKLKSLGHQIGALQDFYISEYTSNNHVAKAVFSGTQGEVVMAKQDLRKAFGYNEIKSILLTIVPDNAFTVTDGYMFEEKGRSSVHVVSGDGSTTTLSGEVVLSDGSKEYVVPNVASSYKILGKGWGHGLGMSQWGAKKMAEQGFTFEDILTFYYTGTYIE